MRLIAMVGLGRSIGRSNHETVYPGRLNIYLSGFSLMECAGLKVFLTEFADRFVVDPDCILECPPEDQTIHLYILYCETHPSIDKLKALAKADFLSEAKLLVVIDEPSMAIINYLQSMKTDAYLLKKELSRETLSAAIKTVVGENGFYLNSKGQLAVAMAQMIRDSEKMSDRTASLTQKQLLIVELVAAGFDCQEIATRIQRTTGTINRHRSIIMDKLGVKTFDSAIAVCVQARVVDPAVIMDTRVDKPLSKMGFPWIRRNKNRKTKS